MLRSLIIWLLVGLCCTCSNRTAMRSYEDDNFGFDEGDGVDKVDDKAYFSDLEKSEAVVGFESSFPLPFMVNKSIDLFDNVPLQAKSTPPSQVTVHLGPCHFAIKTTMIQVDRYILAGQWIRLNEGLPAKVPVRLEPHMDLNLKLVSKLVMEVPSSQLPLCQKLLNGKRIYLGRLHLNNTKIGLLTGPGYPRVVFASRTMELKGKRVFIRWQSGSSAPSLIDDFDFPATAESGIFRAFMGDKGYYYLVIQPVLRMDQVDQLVVKLPITGAKPDELEKKPRAKRKKSLERKGGADEQQ